ncbi:MAG TPA: nicotinate phosphoribosyltransferase, partial [Verrucomicrobiae bacterium]|nr:nicotinate phosphoribosyltransferase [Verrucomicrobiae bacterium]
LEVFKGIKDEFFDCLLKMKFTGNLWAVPEGTILFPNEPILRIEAPIIEAQILETYILSIINFQTLIATKASRITNVSNGKPVIEFGSRRAHGPQAGLLAARAAYIGGCAGTSNTLAGMRFDIPVFGTMAHSFIMSFENELDAFRQFHNVFPSSFLLVDTYDTLNAIRMIIRERIYLKGIRLDSGDLLYLSKEARKLLDETGDSNYLKVKIMASSDLNEYIIYDLVKNNAPIDIFAVGTELCTSRDDPAFNGVYKMVAVELQKQMVLPQNKKNNVNNQGDSSQYFYSKNGQKIIFYKIKTSPGKKAYPGPKQIHRILDKSLNLSYDIVTLEGEVVDKSIPLLKKIIENGYSIYSLPSLKEIQEYYKNQLQIISDFIDIYKVPESFPVRYSQKLDKIYDELFKEYNNQT